MAEDLETARAKRWWQAGKPIARIDRAARFIDDVGFALLFPKKGVGLPTLWEAATDRPVMDAQGEWAPEMERVWRWKDELPRRGLAWYGEFVRGRKSFLSPALLTALYPRSGHPEDFEEATFSPDARRIARILLLDGPQSTAVLREALDVEGSRGAERFGKAVGELARVQVVTHFGTRDEGGGWPSAVLELTARAFSIPRTRDADACRLRVARTFLDTMIVAQPYHLGNAFHGGATAARVVFLDGNAFTSRPGPRLVEAAELLAELIGG